MPFCVVGRGRASLCAKYHHRLGQPPIRTTLFGSLASAAGSSKNAGILDVVEYGRIQQRAKRSSPGTATSP